MSRIAKISLEEDTPVTRPLAAGEGMGSGQPILSGRREQAKD